MAELPPPRRCLSTSTQICCTLPACWPRFSCCSGPTCRASAARCGTTECWAAAGAWTWAPCAAAQQSGGRLRGEGCVCMRHAGCSQACQPAASAEPLGPPTPAAPAMLPPSAGTAAATRLCRWRMLSGIKQPSQGRSCTWCRARGTSAWWGATRQRLCRTCCGARRRRPQALALALRAVPLREPAWLQRFICRFYTWS